MYKVNKFAYISVCYKQNSKVAETDWGSIFAHIYKQMISAEAPLVFSKACELFVKELTLRAWIHTEDNKRRTLQVTRPTCWRSVHTWRLRQRFFFFQFYFVVVAVAMNGYWTRSSAMSQSQLQLQEQCEWFHLLPCNPIVTTKKKTLSQSHSVNGPSVLDLCLFFVCLN